MLFVTVVVNASDVRNSVSLKEAMAKDHLHERWQPKHKYSIND